MAQSIPNRKREAGRRFVSACERLIRVEGPTALAQRTHRSQAWWSKLSNGMGARFPAWPEVVELLGEHLTEETSAEVRRCYEDALLLWHGAGD